MVPFLRPEKTSLTQHRTCVSDELDRAGADIALKVHNMKLLYAGYAPRAIEANEDLEIFVPDGASSGPQTLTEHVRQMQEQS